MCVCFCFFCPCAGRVAKPSPPQTAEKLRTLKVLLHLPQFQTFLSTELWRLGLGMAGARRNWMQCLLNIFLRRQLRRVSVRIDAFSTHPLGLHCNTFGRTIYPRASHLRDHSVSQRTVANRENQNMVSAHGGNYAIHQCYCPFLKVVMLRDLCLLLLEGPE